MSASIVRKGHWIASPAVRKDGFFSGFKLMHLVLKGMAYMDGATAGRSFAQKDALWMTGLDDVIALMLFPIIKAIESIK